MTNARNTGLEEPERPAARSAPSLHAFLGFAFRPLYMGAAAWAIVAIAIWIYAPQLLRGPLQGVVWHAHEMLWGFIATIAVAFLMTAGASWTGINPLQNGPLAAVCVLWLIARLGFLAGGDALYDVATAAELLFFLYAALAMMRAVYRSRNVRNYAVPWLLVGLGGADALYLAAARGGDYTLLMQRFSAGLLVMALVALLIARRVIPFFAMRAVNGMSVPMLTRWGQVQLGGCAVAIVSVFTGWHWLQAAGLALAGAIALAQIVLWKPLAVRGNPLLWILYIGYTALGAGLLVAACAAAGAELRAAVPVHVIGMAGFCVLIIGMLTRTALGHLGRPLAVDRSMLVSYVLMLIAVALRLIALWPSAFTPYALDLSAAAWIAVFVLYLWRFVPMMIRPRL